MDKTLGKSGSLICAKPHAYSKNHYQLLGRPLLCPCPYLKCIELVHMISGLSIEAQEGLEKLG